MSYYYEIEDSEENEPKTYKEYVKERNKQMKEEKKRIKKLLKNRETMIRPFSIGFNPYFPSGQIDKLEEGCFVSLSMNEQVEKGNMEGDPQHLNLFAKVVRGKFCINLRGAKVALDKLAKAYGLKLEIKYRRNFLQLFKRGKKR